MEVEFQESDVIFGDHDRRTPEGDDAHDDCGGRSRDDVTVPFHRDLPACGLSNKQIRKNRKRRPEGRSSPPVDIPLNVLQLRDFEEYFDEGEDGNDGEMVPPHLIVDRRRIDGELASSVCFSHGRTLKGRYLSEVRNSILRMTGFLES